VARLQETVQHSAKVFEGRLISVRVDTVRLPDGRVSTREVVEHPGAVAVVPIDDQRHVLLVRQFRYAIGRELLEIPAGTREPHETPEQTAHRELEEEIGHRAATLQELFQVYLAPGYSTERIHYFLATDLQPVKRSGDDDEFIEVVRIPLVEALKKIETGDFQDAKTVAALVLAARRIEG